MAGRLDGMVALIAGAGSVGPGRDVAHAALDPASDEAAYATAADPIVNGGLRAQCD